MQHNNSLGTGGCYATNRDNRTWSRRRTQNWGGCGSLGLRLGDERHEINDLPATTLLGLAQAAEEGTTAAAE